MSLFDLMVKSAGSAARPKRRARRSLVIAKGKGLSTPIVIDRGHRQPKTVRSKRRNKIRAMQKRLGVG